MKYLRRIWHRIAGHGMDNIATAGDSVFQPAYAICMKCGQYIDLEDIGLSAIQRERTANVGWPEVPNDRD